MASVDAFPFHINKKPAPTWSIFSSKKLECPSVPVPKQSSSSAAAGHGIFGRKVEQCRHRLVFVLRQGQLRWWDSHGSDRPRWNKGRWTHLYEAVWLSSRSVWHQRRALQMSSIWMRSDPPDQPRLAGQTCKQTAVGGWWADKSRRISPECLMGKEARGRSLNHMRLITGQTSIKMELHGILH